MKILSKNGDEIILLAITNDFANKGDYFIIEDLNINKKLLVQIYDEEYFSSQSLFDEIIKDEVIGKYSSEKIFDPLEINNLSQIIKDVRLLRTKIRGSIDKYDNFTSDVDWVPSRINSKIIKMSYSDIKSLIKKNMQYPISIGKSATDNQSFDIYAEDLDGKLNIITGKKETGKSHLSKILIKFLIQYGAYVIVFDLNNEYSGLMLNNEGRPSPINEKLLLLDEMGHAFSTWNINELVRDALLSRFHIISSSLLFSFSKSNEKGFQ